MNILFSLSEVSVYIREGLSLLFVFNLEFYKLRMILMLTARWCSPALADSLTGRVPFAPGSHSRTRVASQGSYNFTNYFVFSENISKCWQNLAIQYKYLFQT